MRPDWIAELIGTISEPEPLATFHEDGSPCHVSNVTAQMNIYGEIFDAILENSKDVQDELKDTITGIEKSTNFLPMDPKDFNTSLSNLMGKSSLRKGILTLLCQISASQTGDKKIFISPDNLEDRFWDTLLKKSSNPKVTEQIEKLKAKIMYEETLDKPSFTNSLLQDSYADDSIPVSEEEDDSLRHKLQSLLSDKKP